MAAYPRTHIISWLLMPLSSISMLISLALVGSQFIVRLQMKEKLERENLVSVRLNRHTLVWADEGKELLLNGRLFDVVSMENFGETTVVSGLFDEQETGIRRQLDYLLTHQRNNPEKKDLLYRVLVNITWDSAVQEIFFGTPLSTPASFMYQWKKGHPLPPNRPSPFLPPDRA